MRLLSRLLLPLAATLLLATACKKDKVAPADQLPAATTTGADTWGCLVNGQVWKNTGLEHVRADWTTPDGVSASMGFSEKVDNITQYNTLLFAFPDSTQRYSLKTGTYVLTNGTTGNGVQLQKLGRVYRSRQLLSGKVELSRLDRQVGIMSGTFDFIMLGSAGDTLRVTSGRFDISHMDL